MRIPRWFRPGEYTSVNAETEIGIPTMTWVIMSVSGNIAVLGGHLVRFLLQLRKALRSDGTFLLWWTESYRPWISVNWPVLPALCILWTISVPLWAFLYRMFIEQLFKQWYSVDVYAFISSLLKRKQYIPQESLPPRPKELNVNLGMQTEKEPDKITSTYRDRGYVNFSNDIVEEIMKGKEDDDT